MALFNTDVPELSGSDTAVCLDNLELLGLRQSRVTESMLAELAELSDAVIRDAGGDPDTVMSILLSLQGDGEDDEVPADAIASSVAPINRDFVRRLAKPTEVQMRLILYRMIADRMPPKVPPRRAADTVAETARGRIAYMGGAFADKAYLHLSPMVPNARAATFHSFVDACEEVRGGLCEYGILPLENTQSGKLTAFSRLILRYGLCTVAVCDLENGATPGQMTRFALLRKAPAEGLLASLDTHAARGQSPHCLELLHLTPSPTLSELLTAAAFCGLSPVRIDTLPRFEELDLIREDAPSGTPPMCCVLTTDRADLATFARFLALEAPEDTVMGIYGTVSNTGHRKESNP